MISPLDPGSLQKGATTSPGQSQVIALRVAVIGAVLLALFAIVFFRLWFLQVLSGNSLAAEAASNRSRSETITAPRGEILDRNGNKLVNNRRARVVQLAPNSLPSQERTIAAEYGEALSKWSDRVVRVYGSARFVKWTDSAFPESVKRRFPKPQIPGLNTAAVLEKYAEGEEQQLADLRIRYERLGKLLQLEPDEVRRRTITSLVLVPYAPVPLKKQTPPDIVEYIAENQDQFPGVSTDERYVRSYPHKSVSAQIFGQVGSVPIDPKTGESSIEKYRKLPTSSQVGVNGLELKYDSYLRGKDGELKTTVDASGNVIGDSKTVAPQAGNKLQLTVDLPLSIRAQKSLAVGSKFNPNGLPGAIVAMDPRDGSILAMASNPTFDPTVFVRGVSQEFFDGFLNNGVLRPLFNRAITGGYAPGSTFKPVTAFAAVANGKIAPDTTFYDEGKIVISDQPFQNAGGIANGPVDMTRALEVSSDTYFYDLGQKLNTLSKPQPLQQWARRLGFDHTTGIDIGGENDGIIPDVDWRAKYREDELECRRKNHLSLSIDLPLAQAAAGGCGISDMRTWSVGDNVQLAIGQGDVNVTPLQMATLYAAIENGGNLVHPHLAERVLERTGGTQSELSFPIRKKVDLADTGALDAVRQGLFEAANGSGGTSAGVFANWPRDRYPIYGKTGTAQKENAQGVLEDTSWYAAYVPDEQRPIVVAVVVEKGGYGAEKAAPIAGQLLAQWFGLKDVKFEAGDSTTR